MMNNNNLQTVVETPEFLRQAKVYMQEDLKSEFIDFIAKNPLAGELIPGTGGARKVRWSSGTHQGKRGGVRIIYYYTDQRVPIFLLTVYSKNQKANLTNAEKNLLLNINKLIVKNYRGS